MTKLIPAFFLIVTLAGCQSTASGGGRPAAEPGSVVQPRISVMQHNPSQDPYNAWMRGR